jgi:anti-anti-sigma factor
MASPLQNHSREDLPAPDVTVVHFTGRTTSLDEQTVHLIQDQLLALADETGDSDLFLDFDNVEYISSQALGTLISLRKQLFSQGRHLTIGNLSPHVHEVFAITKLDKLLDLRLAAEEGEPVAEDSPVRPSPGVLVVDDETVVLCVLASALRREGFQVWLAVHGQEGIELYRRYQEEIVVVLLDVRMPGMDGPHTLTALRKIDPDVCCCFMTGNPAPYTEEDLLEMGALRVFDKPFVFAEILDTLHRLAQQSSQRRQDRWIEIPRRGA